MTETNYSELKTTLLEIWVPPVGVRSVADLWSSLIGQLKNHAYATVYTDLVRQLHISKRRIERYSSFKTNIDCYFDKEPPFQVGETFLSGSWAEGLFLYGENTSMELPDMDFMSVLKNISFSREDQKQGCLLLREDTPFVHAFITDEQKLKTWSDYFANEVHFENKRRLSARKLKEKLQKNCKYIGNLYCYTGNFGEEEREKLTEGAAITIKKPKPDKSYTAYFTEGFLEFGKSINEHTFSNILEAAVMGVSDIYYKIVPSTDIVLSIFCEGWPSCAREWITRERFWPDIQSVEKIAQGGFHIVPKSSPDGEFRLSFSCAEVILIQTLSPLQHKVLRAFKAVVKYHQNSWSQNLKEIISSYHLKTISFWHFEKTSQEFWTEETLFHHLVTLLEKLAEVLRMQSLSMYFMPKVNLFKCNDPEVALELMANILQISRNVRAISVAIKSINLSKYFRAREKEFKILFKNLNAESAKEESSLHTMDTITLWSIWKTVTKICKNQFK